MSRTKLLFWGIVVGLLGILLLAGCVPGQPGTTPGQQGSSDWTLIIFLVLIFAVFYFLMIRPQRKRQKQQQKMVSELQRGDRVITAGGIYGEIDSVSDDTINLKIESGAVIKMAKGSVIGKISQD